MKIACIGWGSLIWDSQDLPLKSTWYSDGPLLPIEFSRESSDGRMTLILLDNSDNMVNSLWSLLSVTTLHEAKIVLAKREGISDKNIKYSIGYWDKDSNSSHGLSSLAIETWAKDRNLDAVVWTNLKFGFKSSRDIIPEYSTIIKHFQSLSKEQYMLAEQYVRKTPKQVKTPYRLMFERDLAWTAINL